MTEPECDCVVCLYLPLKSAPDLPELKPIFDFAEEDTLWPDGTPTESPECG
jgi:hypothetical protein